MCGRYVFSPESSDYFYDRFDIKNRDVRLDKNYNVVPGELMPTITRNSPNRVVMMKWGLVPYWAKDPKIGYKMINARSETITEKPSYKKAFVSQRCLVPANGFYEWKKIGSSKVPFFIHLKKTQTFSLAGLYDIWTDKDGKKHFTYTIITTFPNKIMEDIHDRMPVILSKKDENTWLNPNSDIIKLKKLLKPYNLDDMEAYIISTKVNSPHNNSSDLLTRAV